MNRIDKFMMRCPGGNSKSIDEIFVLMHDGKYVFLLSVYGRITVHGINCVKACSLKTVANVHAFGEKHEA